MNYIDFVKKHNGRVVAFKNLPESHQMALIWYMAVDGGAWDELFVLNGVRYLKKNIRKVLPEYIKKYGHLKFGMVEIPADVAKDEMLKSANSNGFEFKTFSHFYKWYLNENRIPQHSHKNRWPCILSTFDDEFLSDGFHRFHSYIRSGHKTIPCVSYLPKIKYKLD